MRQIINHLCEHFGDHQNAAITNWVNEQYLFRCESNGIQFSLRDIDETVIWKTIHHTITDLGLTLEQLIDGVWLAPVFGPGQLEFEVTAELRPALFKSVLSQFLDVCNDGFIYAQDSFKRYGADRHIDLIKQCTAAPCTEDVVYAFFNATVSADGQPVSCFLTAEEVSEIKACYIKTKFNGADPFGDANWSEMQLAAVYRRFLSESIFSALEYSLPVDVLQQYVSMTVHGHSRFEKTEDYEKDLSVLGAHGRVIGRKVVRFKAHEALEQKNKTAENRKSLNSMQADIVDLAQVRQSKAAVAEPTQQPVYDTEDVPTEWGNF